MLSHKIRAEILSLLKTTKEGTCTKKYGYIVRVISLDEIHDARFCIADKTNHFTVIYTINSFIPVIGDVYSATVFKTYTEGILANIEGYNNVRVLLPPGPQKCDDMVRVLLKAIQFTNNTFMGVCDIV